MKIIRIMGSDKRVCQAARVSLNKDKTEHSVEDDIKLIRYLRKHKHTSPFEHVRVTFDVHSRAVFTREWMQVLHTESVTEIWDGILHLGFRITADLNNLLKILEPEADLMMLLLSRFPALKHDATERSDHEDKEQPTIELYGGQGSCTLVDYMCEPEGEEHAYITFLVDAPKFVTVQHMRHRSWSYNEVSRRYTSEDVRIWQPTEYRGQAKRNLQASDGLLPPDNAEVCQWSFARAAGSALFAYNTMLDIGLAREQARAVLPMGMMTRYYATCSLKALKDFIRLRIHDGAQPEITELAQAMQKHALAAFGDR